MSNSKKVLSNILWRMAERLGAKAVQFIVEIILARLLAPESYGTIALITVFITILQVFVDSGLGNALIQKKDADDLDFSTVFYFNMGMCSVLYLIIFFCAPLIASFYNNMDLISIIRVLGLVIIISGLKNVQQAYVSRNLMFKRFFFSTLGGTIIAACIGIAMAYIGFGVWALVSQMLFNTAIDTLILWLTVKWRPKKKFSFERFKGLFSYGWKLLVSSLIDTVYNDIRQLVIGKMYTSNALAFYNQGKKIPMYLVTNLNQSIDSVLLPTLSQSQDNPESVKIMTRRAITTTTYIIAPLMMGLAFSADTFVPLLLTEKWIPAIPFLRIFCITYMFYPIHTANLNAIKAMGRSDLFLILEIIKKSIGIILLLITMWHGVMMMAYSLLISSFISQIVNTWPNKKLLNYGYLEQIKDILPGVLLAVVMGIAVYFIGFFQMPLLIKMLIQVVSGMVIYLVLSLIFKVDSLHYILGIIQPAKLIKKGK